MEILQSIFSNTIIAFIILIGVVVFVHELGHFLAGKAFGIQVEEFSIGFGPKAFSIRKGTTEYRINWLPLGGYVRFYGADIDEDIPLEKREQSILHAKVHKRAIVSFAGPLANFILSFIVMTGISISGTPHQPAIFSVLPNSVAEKAGLQSGDKVISIDNENIKSWAELTKKISKSPEKNLILLIERNGESKKINISPAKEEVETPLGNKQVMGRIGVFPLFSSPHLVVSKDSFFNFAGFKTGDKVLSFNGKKIEYFYQIIYELENISSTKSEILFAHKINNDEFKNSPVVTFLIERKNTLTGKFEQKNIEVNLSSNAAKGWAKNFINRSSYKTNSQWTKTLLSSDQTVGTFPQLLRGDKFIPAQDAWKKCGLNEGDTIYSVEGVGRILSSSQFATWLDSAPKSLLGSSNQANNFNVKMQVLNASGVIKSLNCEIPLRSGFDHLNRVQVYLDFPVQFISQNVFMPSEIIKAQSFSDALNKGFSSLLEQFKLLLNGIKMLVTGSIPLSNLGGPIAIAGVAGDAAKGGLMVFLITMAFISTNVGMMNLLPLPALDGGTLLLQAVEAAYGKPLPKSVQLAVQRVGIFIILGLFILVFYNDILRLIRF